MVATVGDIVLYRLTAYDITRVRRMRAEPTSLNLGDEYPAIVVRVYSDDPCNGVSLLVFLGPDTLHVDHAPQSVPSLSGWQERNPTKGDAPQSVENLADAHYKRGVCLWSYSDYQRTDNGCPVCRRIPR